MAVILTDPFFRQLYTKLVEEIEKRSDLLISGGALMHNNGIGVDPTATAMKYQEAVSYIRALNDIIELGISLEHDRYGNRSEGD
jgi:hypothetical protein